MRVSEEGMRCIDCTRDIIELIKINAPNTEITEGIILQIRAGEEIREDLLMRRPE